MPIEFRLEPTGVPSYFVLCVVQSSKVAPAAFFRVNMSLFLKKMYILLRKGAAMSNKEALHQLYAQCKNINFDESYDLIASAEDSDEADFFRMATDLVLKQKQRKAVEENRF
ncbi:hypothetical protein B7988_08475 [Fibrobacter sp. UWB1]|nr:hypothetical protein B7988_08475 [Fibrobacter sp. UWB1]